MTFGTRREFLKHAAAVAASGLLPAPVSAAAPEEPKAPFNIRTLTAGVTLSREDYASQLGRAREFLGRGRQILEAAGYTLQTQRITTQPHAAYLRRATPAETEALLRDMQEITTGCRLAIGPGAVAAGGEALAIERALRSAGRDVASSIRIADRGSGIDAAGVAAAATVIRQIANGDPLHNFSFAAIANVPPGVPFFPAGYHDGGAPSFSLGTEAAGLFMRICEAVGDLGTAAPILRDAFDRALEPLQRTALQIQTQTGWHYAGIDPTPAQWGELSIGTAVENLTGAPFGAPGTLAACRALTTAIKGVGVRRTGYQGLFLPPLEDATLARRAFDHYELSALLSYSAVCGTGLDAVAIEGDVSQRELERILYDVAALAVKLDKPLTARLLPLPGKHAGDPSGPVGDLFPMKVLAVR